MDNNELKSILEDLRETSVEGLKVTNDRISDLEQKSQERMDALDSALQDIGASGGAKRGSNVDYERGLVEFAENVKALVEGSGSGAIVVPPEFSASIFDRLAAQSVGLRSGFRVIETASDELHLPKVTSDVTAAFVAEAGAIGESDPGLDEEVATPRKLAALTTMSTELVMDSNPAVTAIVRDNMARAIALALDLAFYEGNGVAPNPTGLRNVTGIQTLAHNAALTDLDPFADAIGMLAEENAEASAIVMHPRDWRTLMKLKQGAANTGGENVPLLTAENVGGEIRRTIFGVPVYLSSQLATDGGVGTNESTIYVYQADQVVAVRREDLRVETNPYSLFANDQIQLRSISRWDIVVPQPKAVLTITGVQG